MAAIQHETKLSAGLYAALGKDVNHLSKQIAGEVSRGLSGGQMYPEITRNVSSWCGISLNNAMRIVRTEGHRIQCKATADAQWKAKEKGTDVVKQWDSSLDGKTRDAHRQLDGQIQELEDAFEVGGMSAMQPGDFGDPAEDCNCRCALLQRARWALGNDATKWSADAQVQISDDGTTQLVDLSDAKNYNDFKDRYKGLAASVGGNGIPIHEEHILLKTIDYSNKAAVMNEMVSFEKEAIKEIIETACVVTKSGEVYKCFGVEDRVFPDSDLGNLLIGSTISHNHPIEETTHSFSKDDLMLFQEYNLDVLRGCDELYTYEFTRDANKIDESPVDWMNFENYQHADIINLAKQYGIGYRRWKNE
ncbi:MAG: phage minor head protein [Anaerovorax sp.]